MLVTSRSYAEYEAMFDLKELPDSILDCCAGGAGFTAEAAERGVDAIAADPAYELETSELVDSVRRSLPATSGSAFTISATELISLMISFAM